MIPVLFAPNTTNFTSNGLGALADCISCKVTEKRNGEYLLSMQYPLDGIHFADIRHSSIIWAKPSDSKGNQAFRIYKIKKPMNGIVTIEAEHISYQMSKIPVMPFTANSASAALQGLKTNAAEACPFFFYTDKQTIATYNQELPSSMRSQLGGVQGSILDVYGGEYEFDNYDVHLWASRGSDKGVALRYGKNIIDLSQEENIQNVITGILPYWANETTVVTLPEKVVESEYTSLYPYPRTIVVDFSSDWTEEAPTEAQLRARAEKYIEDNNIGIPKISISVSFIALWQTEEFKSIAPLERVDLCDTITVIFDKLGIEAKAKVITTEYDVLRERYNKIEVGDAKSTLASTIVEIDSTTNQKIEVVKSWTDKAIVHATELITGGLGGYVYMKPNADGQPEEILIMDSPDIGTAVNIWRWNKGGLGFSSNGYGGPYGTAITSDGQIVADFITAGALQGGIIQAGTIEADALSAEAKEELIDIHDYVASNIMDSIDNWKWRDAAAGTVSIAQIDGEYCLALDGTELSAYDSAFYAQTKLQLNGKQTLKISYKQRFSDDVDITNQRSNFLYIKAQEDGLYWIFTRNIAGDFEKDIWYEVSYELEMSKSADLMNYVPDYGIYHIPGVIRYIKDLKIETRLDGYTSASMDFSYKGFNLAIAEAKGTHDYCPYDIMSNIARWTGRASFPQPSYETIDSKVYVKLDGTGATGIGADDFCKVYSDYLGKPTLNVKFKLRFNHQYTTVPGEKFFILEYKDEYGNYRDNWQYWPTSRTFEADTDYDISFSITPSYDAFTQQAIGFFFHIDVITYITDISVTTTEEAYNSASLKIDAHGLSSTVRSGNVISTINQTAEQVTIRANKLDLTGDLSLHGDFTSYDSSDDTTYAFMDSASISFFNSGANVFTIAAIPILGNNAGIFFGDVDDPATLVRYTWMNQEYLQTPSLLVRKDGSYTVPTGEGAALIEGDFTVRGSSRFYGNVYNSGGGVQFVSDRRKKRNILDLAVKKARSFIMALKPVKYKFTKDVSTSNRFHHGFIAQDVKKAMPEDWGIYCENNKDDFIGLRYDEFIADMVALLQDHEKRINKLEKELKRSNK